MKSNNKELVSLVVIYNKKAYYKREATEEDLKDSITFITRGNLEELKVFPVIGKLVAYDFRRKEGIIDPIKKILVINDSKDIIVIEILKNKRIHWVEAKPLQHVELLNRLV